MTNTIPQTDIDIVGHYRCEGGDYRGDVVIREMQGSFAVHWMIGGSVQVGIGLRDRNSLAVCVAVPTTAAVLYDIRPGPSLIGKFSVFPPGGPVSEEVLSFSHALQSWEIGDRLLAKWSRDPFWYPATVIEKADEDRCCVRFADGDEEWLGRSQMAPELLTVTDIVYHTGGLFHKDESGNRVMSTVDPSKVDTNRLSMSCRVIGREGDTLRLQYEDGVTITTSLDNVRTLAPREH